MTVHPSGNDDEAATVGRPIPGSRPEFLATIARLRGMRPCDVSRARVWELGCGTGENLLPMAERHPRAYFLGTDPSTSRIELARRAATDLRLTNIQFRRLEIADLPALSDTFDYVVAAGIYSRVGAASRDQLLAACRARLAPQGVAYISYNVYPGWHVHDMFRALMQYEARAARTTTERLACARRLLRFLDDSLAEENPLTATLKVQLTPLLARSDADLLGEYLSDVNQPVYFRRFVAHAGRHQLKPIGDAAFGIRVADRLGMQAEQDLAELTTDAVEQEHYRDIVRNRAARETLLCHAELPVEHELRPELLRGMNLAARLKPEALDFDRRTSDVARFETPDGRRIVTPVPIVKAALVQLGAAWPNYVSLDDLAAAATACLADADHGPMNSPAREINRLLESLLACCAAGIIELDLCPQNFVGTVTDLPAASQVARRQAERGSTATDRKHATIRLDDFERQVLVLLDGTRDASQLLDSLAAASPALPRKSLAARLNETLSRFAENALLIG